MRFIFFFVISPLLLFIQQSLFLTAFLIVFLPALFSVNAFAAISTASDPSSMTIQLSPQDRLVLRYPQADLTIKPSRLKTSAITSDTVEVRIKSNIAMQNMQVRRTDANTVVISNNSTQDTSASSQAHTAGSESVTATSIEIETSKSLPVEALLQQGSIQIESWKAPISALLVQGKIKTKETEGRLQLNLMKGDVEVQNHVGAVELEGSDVAARLKKVGRVDEKHKVSLMSGSLQIEDLKGSSDFFLYSGQADLQRVEGSVQAQINRSNFNLKGHQSGSLRAQVASGRLRAELGDSPEVHINSDSGVVELQTLPQSSPVVRLQVEDGGNITAPEELSETEELVSAASGTSGSRADRHAKRKVVRGALRGGGQGSIQVHAKTGSIRLLTKK